MKKMIRIGVSTLMLVAWLGVPSLVAAPRELNDAEMDEISAGKATEEDATAKAATLAEAPTSSIWDNSIHTISLSDQAQQNLTSMVNILSVNSSVQVLLNLNVSINSTIGTVNQGNFGTQAGTPALP